MVVSAFDRDRVYSCSVLEADGRGWRDILGGRVFKCVVTRHVLDGFVQEF